MFISICAMDSVALLHTQFRKIKIFEKCITVLPNFLYTCFKKITLCFPFQDGTCVKLCSVFLFCVKDEEKTIFQDFPPSEMCI